MIDVLRHKAYRHLYFSQLLSILGTGLATVALGLLAFEFSGSTAGALLGTAMAIRMAANMGVSTLASAFISRLPRRSTLVAMDGIRVCVAVMLPFVGEIWHIFVLIFILQSASAVSSPIMQATIPDIFPDERRYTRALSMTRIAYDMETVVSPLLAGLLLFVMTFHNLFFGTALGFVFSAGLIATSGLPATQIQSQSSPIARMLIGFSIYLRTPRLRGVLALGMCAAMAITMVVANTVVIVQGNMALGAQYTTLALAFFGLGSITAAFALPRLLDSYGDRMVMLSGGLLLVLGLGAGHLLTEYWHLLVIWAVLGTGFSAIQTPIGRVLTRSCDGKDRNEAFAAQFALSHACRLVGYLVCGLVGAQYGIGTAFLVIALLCAGSLAVAASIWPRIDPSILYHRHDDLHPDDPHWGAGGAVVDGGHAHAFAIDSLHRRWPRLK